MIKAQSHYYYLEWCNKFICVGNKFEKSNYNTKYKKTNCN